MKVSVPGMVCQGYGAYNVAEVGDGTEHVLDCGVDLCIQNGRGCSKMGWDVGRAEMVRGVGAEVDGEELCGRGWDTAFGDSGGLHVGGQIVGDLVVLRDRLRRSIEREKFSELTSSARAGEEIIMQRELELQTDYN